MDPDQERLLRASLRELFTAGAGDPAAQLAELGWDEVVADDPAAVALLFGEQGRALAATPLLDRVVLAELGDALPAPVDAVCYPLSTPCPEGTFAAILLAALRSDATVLIPETGPGGSRLAAVPAAALEVAPADTFDADVPWQLVRGPLPTNATNAPGWPRAVAAGRRALAAEILATAQEAIRLAVEHTSARRQFGVPIATFQSVRHRIAEAQALVSGAHALLGAAYQDGGTFAAAAAKAAAGRAHERTSHAAIQVCGAMGVTSEHPLHRYVTRGAVLDALLDDHWSLTRMLGAEVLVSGETPYLIDV